MNIEAVVAMPVNHCLAFAEVISKMISPFIPGIQSDVAEATARDNRTNLRFPVVNQGKRFQVMDEAKMLGKMVFTLKLPRAELAALAGTVVMLFKMVRRGVEDVAVSAVNPARKGHLNRTSIRGALPFLDI